MMKLKILKRGLSNFLQDRKEIFTIPSDKALKFSLGQSFEKRPIRCYRIGQGERKILFVSAIHGNETGTTKLAYFLLEHLSRNEKRFENFSCFVVPCLNVDGFEKAKGMAGYFEKARGRLNSKNVDLNRNFPTENFRSRSCVLPGKNNLEVSKYSREIPADDPEAKSLDLAVKNCGEFGAFEPETKALVDFIKKEKISVIFSFHNSGRDVMGGKDDLSKKLVKIYAKETGYEILEDDEWWKIGQTGTIKDWCDEQNISFVEVEGSTRYGSDWDIQKPALEAVLGFLSGAT